MSEGASRGRAATRPRAPTVERTSAAARARATTGSARADRRTGSVAGRLQQQAGNRGTAALLRGAGRDGSSGGSSLPPSSPSDHQTAVASGGAPLPRDLRTSAEQRLGIALGGVRVHGGAAAHRAAAGLAASAYTVGHDIVLGGGTESAPPSARRSVLAHELVHVAQAGSVTPTLRAVAPSNAPAEREAHALAPRLAATSTDAAPLVPRQRRGAGVAHRQPAGSPADACQAPPLTSPDASFDPEAIDVVALTNRDLIVKSELAKGMLAANPQGDQEWAAYDRLRVRLAEERERRVGLGHLWLAGNLDVVDTVVQLVPGGDDRLTVRRAPEEIVYGPPDALGTNAVMTGAQFAEFLAAEGIPTIDANTYQAIERSRQIAAGGGIDPRLLLGGFGGPGDASGFGFGGLGGFGYGGVQGIGVPGLDTSGTWAGFGARPDDQFGRLGAMGTVGSRAYLPQFGRANQGAFAHNDSAGWHGPLGEGIFEASPRGRRLTSTNSMPWIDANGNPHAAIERAFPLIDFADDPGLRQQLYSVKSGVSANPATRMNTYLKGHADFLGTLRESGQLTSSLPTLLQNMQPGTTQADVAARTRLVVNADDVTALRQLYEDPFARRTPKSGQTWQLQPVQQVYDGYLQARPFQHNGVDYTSVAQLQSAQQAGTLPQTQFEAALRRAGTDASAAVVSSEATTVRLQAERATRRQLGSRRSVDLLGSGEHLAAGQHGQLGATTRASGRGGLFGAALSLTMHSGMMMFDDRDHPEWGTELAHTGFEGGMGGAIGGGVEQVAASRVTTYLATQGMTSPGAALMGRGLAGGAGGGAASIAIEWYRILNEDREHSNAEVALRTGRAFVIGGVSGYAGAVAGGFAATVLSSALAGTAIGTAVPGLGNAIGFVVGLGVGIGIAVAMDRALPQVSPDVGQAPSATSTAPTLMLGRGGCFTGDTAVLLADGTVRSIRLVVVGDRVRSVDPLTGRCGVATVEAVHHLGPRAITSLAVEGLRRVLDTTAEHPILTPTGWSPAGSLRRGDRVAVAGVDGAGGEVVWAHVQGRVDHPPRPVHNLQVSGDHTYVAGGVIVHNKNM